MTKTVYVTIACDTDPDRKRLLPETPDDSLRWRGLTEGIPAVKTAVRHLVDDSGRGPKFTWCLRVDHQVQKLHGSFEYVLTEHNALLKDVAATGDELSWHPHFWRYDAEKKIWYQELNDKAWQVRMLEEAVAAYRRVFPDHPRTLRTGWDYHSPESFAAIDKLGLEVDLSAVPSQETMPTNSEARSSNFYDWAVTPNEPYRPSRSDFRRACKNGEQAYNIWEFPVFVSRSLLWGLIRGAVSARRMKDPRKLWRGLLNPSYFANITARPRLYSAIISQMRKELAIRDKLYFVTFFHPDEVLPNVDPLYSLENMRENLERLRAVAHRSGAKLEFVTARELKDRYVANLH